MLFVQPERGGRIRTLADRVVGHAGDSESWSTSVKSSNRKVMMMFEEFCIFSQSYILDLDRSITIKLISIVYRGIIIL